MKNGERPEVFGDGTQTRDFIYIDDIVDNIQGLANKGITGIVPVGTGINTSFNEVVATINKVLGTNLEPVYVGQPKHYIHDTPVPVAPFGVKVSLEEGIRKILASL